MSVKKPGVVRMGMIRRLPSLSPEEFSAHWSGPHGVFATRIPNLRRYHQHHAIRPLPLGELPDKWQLDGLSELWFDDIDSMMAGITSPDYDGLAQDTPTVMTMPGLIVGNQEFLLGDRPDEASHVKAMIVVGRRQDADAEAFLQAWRERVAALSGTPGLAASAIISIVHRESVPAEVIDYASLPVDIVVELWFETAKDLDAAFAGAIPAKLAPADDGLTAYASGFAARTFLIID